ncbi:MAG: pyridoxamine 5'-phosphate oxidase [Candidatus Nanopelagicales bacterium]
MDPVALAALRRSYELAGLDVSDVDPDPIAQFDRWLADSVAADLTEPNAMVLATADATGRPRARTVLLKSFSSRGFTFFTNYESTKGQHLQQNPQASLCFPWYALERQVVVVGVVHRLGRGESERYFHSRPRGSQLGAAASPQSRPIGSRAELVQRYADLDDQYPEGNEIPAPDNWGGYVVVPSTIEFWQGGAHRLHDRINYQRASAPEPNAPTPEPNVPEAEWHITRLSP